MSAKTKAPAPRLCTFEGCTTYITRGERCHRHNGKQLTKRRAAAQERREIRAAMRGLATDDDQDQTERNL